MEKTLVRIKQREALRTKRAYVYMVTICKHRRLEYITESELWKQLGMLLDVLPQGTLFSNIVFELDPKYHQLHLHAICRTKVHLWYKRLVGNEQYQYYWTRVYDIDGVIRYIYKDGFGDVQQNQVFEQNYYHHHYGFTN